MSSSLMRAIDFIKETMIGSSGKSGKYDVLEGSFSERTTGVFTDPTFISDIYIHTLILFTFLTCLFIFYIVKISKDGFKSHIGEILDKMEPKINKINIGDLIQNDDFDMSLKELINSDVFKENIVDINFKNLINKTDDEDKFVKLNNDNINKTLIVVNILLWVFIISIVILYNRVIHGHKSCSIYDKINWMEELVQNTIVFSVIGGLELIFLNNIIVKFVPIKPSFLTTYGLDRIKNKFYVQESPTLT